MTNAYRSKFEAKAATLLRRKRIKFAYEPHRFEFTQPAKKRHYTPDFALLEIGVYVECKGKLTAEDRNKLLWVREQHPNLRIIIWFQRARHYIRKGSKTTYADWAEKNGFEWWDWGTGKGPSV